jgi:uncharacterized membrane protein (UPF0127 family)
MAIVLALVASALSSRVSLAQSATSPRVEEVILETAQGNVTIRAEIADTPQLRQKGLMFRKDLMADAGMLFDFGKPRPVGMWMKNTYVSLDMIFIRADGTVIGIGENTVPLSETVVGFREPVKGVLEVVAGTAARIGLKPGDRVYHAIFGNAPG